MDGTKVWNFKKTEKNTKTKLVLFIKFTRKNTDSKIYQNIKK